MSGFQPITNPYIVGNPIKTKKMFYGRRDDFAFIKRKLEEGVKSYIIIFCGERRSGKTSILFQILNGELGEKFLPVLIDMQTMAGLKNDGELFEKIAKETYKSIKGLKINFEKYQFTSTVESPYKVFDHFLDDILKQFPNKNMIYLIDEYEIIETKIHEGSLSKNFITYLAGILESERKISFVFTGSKNFEERNIEYWHILFGKSLYRNVSFLSQKDTYRLIKEPVKEHIAYNQAVLDGVYRLTAGQPFYTQVVCQNMVDHLNEVQKRDVTIADLEAIAEEIMENPLPQMIYFWNSLADSKKLVLSLMAELLEDGEDTISPEKIQKFASKKDFGLDLSIKIISTTLETLYHSRFLKKQGNSYCFQMDLFRRWIKRDHSIWQVMKEVDIQEVQSLPSQIISSVPGAAAETASPRRRKRILIPLALIFLLVVGWGAVQFFGNNTRNKNALTEGKASDINWQERAVRARSAMVAIEKNASALDPARTASGFLEQANKSKQAALSAFENGDFEQAALLFSEAEQHFRMAVLEDNAPRIETPPASGREKSAQDVQYQIDRMSGEKQSALRLGAGNDKYFVEASRAEKEASALFADRKYTLAESKYQRAADLYRRAQRARMEKTKLSLDSVRESVNVIRAQAESEGAAKLAATAYGNAKAKEQEAENLRNKGQSDRAKQAYQQALALYSDALDKATAARESNRARSFQLQGQVADLRKSLSGDLVFMRSFKKGIEFEKNALALLESRDFAGAADGFQKAKELFSQVQSERIDQVAKIHEVLNKYEKALETENLEALRATHTTISPSEETRWSNFFNSVANIKVSMRVNTIRFEEAAARANVAVQIDFDHARAKDTWIDWEVVLKENGSQWHIDQITEGQP